MERSEREAWLKAIGPTPRERLIIIVDLLRHARKDNMSVEDRSVCREERDRLLSEEGLT